MLGLKELFGRCDARSCGEPGEDPFLFGEATRREADPQSCNHTALLLGHSGRVTDVDQAYGVRFEFDPRSAFVNTIDRPEHRDILG